VDPGPILEQILQHYFPDLGPGAFLAAALMLSATAWAAPTTASPALHSDRFRVSYEEPKDPQHRALYEELKSKHALEKLREFLSFIRLPRILTLKLAGCDGDDNAWYEPEDQTITVCYEYLQAVRKLAPKAATPAGVTPENAFLGPLLEVFLHEIGHALFDQLRIPILGREEDAADQFAAFFLVHLSPQMAREAMGGVAWMYAQEDKDEKISHAALANVHGLAGQRFYNTLCMAYGAEPDVFHDLIETKLLPEDRAEGCEFEYRQVAFAIQALMSRYIDISARDKVLAKDWVGGKFRKKTSRDSEPK
jgi:Putative metallopeptidase